MAARVLACVRACVCTGVRACLCVRVRGRVRACMAFFTRVHFCS